MMVRCANLAFLAISAAATPVGRNTRVTTVAAFALGAHVESIEEFLAGMA